MHGEATRLPTAPKKRDKVSDPVLILDNVVVAFGALKAVKDISLTVKSGERRAIIGPNGAGKTTLFNAITGVHMPTSGRVTFNGVDVSRKSAHVRTRLGMSRTFQITNLFPTLTVSQNMQLALMGTSSRKFSLLGSAEPTDDDQERIDDALGLSKLRERAGAEVRDLSYGEQRQLEMAMALVSKPKLLLLDEPAAGLSPAERVIVTDIVQSLPRDLTVILIEHDMDLVLKLVDWVTCLNNGEFLAEGSPDSISKDQKVQDVYLGKARDHA
ncbi:branched-chain amino acid transport system ATP-binding protein [Aquamicrobium aerolatum DSM 21857]|uniref:Branched-chain amino acid transport system ATP-binding protein n=1 Tax=Aquamicrobium aerolatum DSM 21857 TaxID=1121003 RepID=A0A1I3IFZ1_9HYPH|nr:branched-chain amino acid transport system ATP-binding protein [Aquamicrobium aerolatum DSM 21857]